MRHRFMKELFNTLSKDKFIYRNSIFSLAIIISNFLYIILYYGKLPPFTPLFNQMPWGQQRIAPTIFIFMMPILALTIFFSNLLLSFFLYKRNPLISRLFSTTSLLISILTLIFIIKTIHTVI